MKDIGVVFDATSAKAHCTTMPCLQRDGKKDHRPDARRHRPFTIPVINGDANLGEPNVNMVTCGGQATIPIVYAVKRASSASIYGEIVASICVEIRRTRHARQYRRVHRNHIEGDRECWAARSAARRSSF